VEGAWSSLTLVLIYHTIEYQTPEDTDPPGHSMRISNVIYFFYVLLTVHLVIIFVNNQLDAQFFFMYVYFYSLHFSGSHVPIIRRINCINMTSAICHSV